MVESTLTSQVISPAGMAVTIRAQTPARCHRRNNE
jgi:hypothetical protein